ncbi:tRNA pseudouridine(38-40) synthase TruA [Methanopyrus sp. SNP6]|uniref:tRNA pseudouridine(38-40) synthase TruA n=1 Tax=Methanopyrus sp. SNP6 TaxID=1937005 RepID=UPI0011E5D080|nr:tRNA pseudouridine(38-40) synthase TruA [Methanopyrus sp. SNP6]
MRVALQVAYDGSRYHGFQYQPDVPTIEGALRKALSELRLELVGYASRTDAGAHARYQVVVVEGDPELAQPDPINARLPKDIRVIAKTEVNDEFDPRRDALRKEYRYFLGPLNDPEAAERAARKLEGKHDFSAFRREDGRNPIVTIERCELLEIIPNAYVLRVVAPRFLWEMVRRIAGFVWEVGHGLREEEDAEALLSGEFKPSEKPRCLPAEGLILWYIEYDKVHFERTEAWFEDHKVIQLGGRLLLRLPEGAENC